jgi:hypothetical protein
MDPSANDQAKQRIGAKTSEVDILIIPTSEETTIGRHCSCKTVRELEDLRRPCPGPAPQAPSPSIGAKSCKRQADLIVTR